MRLFLFVILFLICGIISGAANASEFMSFDNPAWTREDAQIRHAVKGKWYSLGEHKQYADNHEFIFKDTDAIVDRIEIPRKPTGEERYTGH